METNEIKSPGAENSVEQLSANLTNGRRWAIIIALFIGQFIGGLSLFRLLPLQSSIMETFGIETGAYGILSTVQTIGLIILPVPVGLLFRKYKVRISLAVMAVMFLLGGALEMAGIASGSFFVFVVGRLLEGAGFPLFSILLFSTLVNVTDDKWKSTLVGLLTIAPVLCQIVYTSKGAAYLAQGGSLSTLILILTVLELVVIAGIALTVPSGLMVFGEKSAVKATREQTIEVYKSWDTWVLGLSYTIFSLGVTWFMSFMMVYFMQNKGLEVAAGAAMLSYLNLVGAGSNLFWGWVSDKLGTKKKIFVFAFVMLAIAQVTLTKVDLLSTGGVILFLLTFGFLPRSVGTLVNSVAPEMTDVPRNVPVINSARDTIKNFGQFFVGMALGYVMQFKGYDFSLYILAALSLLGAVLWLTAKKVK